MSSSLAQTVDACVPPPPAGGINAVAEIKALRIPTGPYAGAYEIAPNGLSNWYFTNLGLISIVQYLDAPDLDKYIRTYLDLYISKLEPDMSIKDVHFPFGRANPSSFTLAMADSDDSYAATTLTLAVRYVRASQNWAWWDKNKTRLKDMAYRNIAISVKPNGLTSVFQAPRSQTNNAGYLMDNCEVYRGLRDFSAMLRERGDTADAAYYDLFAKNIGTALQGLFSAAPSGFRMADLSIQTDTSFYPGTSCQVFPQVFGVTELSGYYDRAWSFLCSNSVGWEKGTLDPYPFAVLGLAAAKRGQTALAKAQLASMEKTFTTNRPMITINEIGFYQRTQSVLAGRADV
ncbi:MAG TPA: hypothetical protein VE934_15685 [Polaromonas sp.]|uniref:hypothetical protein n=1 Tax=Polaromonas sp. TaxID=1869339 RepID=UPI002D72E760|nr:hypothetical protein [Polaromonas sp.]HYW58398.1 hypothetical protein [Polaromonas sp.]